MVELAKEMRKNKMVPEILRYNDMLEFSVCVKDSEKFIYKVMLRSYQTNIDSLDYRVEVSLTNGSQYYNIMGYSKDQVIIDILNHYDKHLHYLHMTVADKGIVN